MWGFEQGSEAYLLNSVQAERHTEDGEATHGPLHPVTVHPGSTRDNHNTEGRVEHACLNSAWEKKKKKKINC